MGSVVDRRGSTENPAAGSRKKLIERSKKNIQDAIKRTIDKVKIKDIAKDRKVSIPKDTLDEPYFHHDPKRGVRERIISGNDSFHKGAIVKKPPPGGADKGYRGEDQDGEFEFLLTKKEFIDLLFEDMSLPDFVKEGMKSETKTKKKRGGTRTEGAMSYLNVKKSLKNALGRRLAYKGAIKKKLADATTQEEIDELSKKKPPFLEDADLRYHSTIEETYPVKAAVMFCIMDVSGSMTDFHKDISKRFFLLLYLFLEKEYEEVEIRFIRHTTTAEEVDEDTFFYGDKSGGTNVAPAFHLVADIIDSEYDVSKINAYVVQASDGDIWEDEDAEDLIRTITTRVLPVVQYLAYMQIDDPRHHFGTGVLAGVYQESLGGYKNFNMATDVDDKSKVFEALRGLFSNV